ncbi:isopentenyl-diphosphate Delta-isomerase [Microbacterium halophytorum]|uniref:isopentenyl-diphosphate Delta-isomerase n=1 Tax=Microbacterium halophytorum TaxID=2067568 RepID=UPI000CFC6D1C|nr:isopentenyl-diphosphate Delta-isomerase [Microbacterium halophytorum]
MTAEELVVLLDEAGREIGTAEKASVHTGTTPLHRAFSCHVFDDVGRVLVTRRSLSKRAWPGVWTNAFCGHPAPGEADAEAIARRAQAELGFEVRDVEVVDPDFRYRATDASGIVENEVCPVYRAVAASAIAPNPAEVSEFAWMDPADLAAAVRAAPRLVSPWLVAQAAASPQIFSARERIGK